jgi:DNA polymerase
VVAKLWLDLETFSPTPIKHGTARYAEEAEIMLVSHAVDDGPVGVTDFTNGEDLPFEVQCAAADPDSVVIFQNGTKFDWTVIAAQWPTFARLVPVERRRDTMVMAYSHSLPGGLEALCDALGVAQDKRKLKTGRDFIRLFCMPPPKNVKRERATRLTHPVEWAAFKDYAGQDIVAMRECWKRCPHWNYPDLAPNGEEWMKGMHGKAKQLILEALDAKINTRGICMDLELAEAAVRVSEIAKKGLAVQTKAMTDGDVGAATQRDEMLKHILEAYGVDLPDMQKDTIERRIADESLPEELRELLRVRLESTTTSVAKYTTLLRAVNSDGRLRGTQQFRGAARTGRVGHRLFQPGNMPRPDMPWKEIYWAIELLKRDTVHLVYANIMRVCSNAIRGTIIAGPGKKLVVADLANIEGRFAAWLAGEEWKLQAFRDYDTFEGVDEKGKPKRKGHDLYILAYASSFNVPPESIDKSTIEGYAMRQIGKVQELMFQYGGGVGAWITGAATYGIDLNAMTEQVYDTVPKWAIDEASGYLEYLYKGPRERYEARLEKIAEDGTTPDPVDAVKAAAAIYEAAKLKLRYGLTEKVFITCDAIKRLWRKAHPEISSYWKELENMIRAAIENPGQRFTARKLVIQRDGAWLRVRLPSGRALCYPSPKWDHVIPAEIDLATGRVLRPAKRFDGFSYMGIHPYSRKWTRIGSYGGKVFENVTQAGSCDQLLECGPLIEEAGFELVLSVHDEWVSEADVSRDDLDDELLGSLMCSNLGWNEGLPLAAAGYSGFRYRKDD